MLPVTVHGGLSTRTEHKGRRRWRGGGEEGEWRERDCNDGIGYTTQEKSSIFNINILIIRYEISI